MGGWVPCSLVAAGVAVGLGLQLKYTWLHPHIGAVDYNAAGHSFSNPSPPPPPTSKVSTLIYKRGGDDPDVKYMVVGGNAIMGGQFVEEMYVVFALR
jgi:hypothetical protein